MKMGWKIWPAELVRRRKIIRASFSQERMTYIAADDSADGTAKVIYDSAALKKQLLIFLSFTSGHRRPIGVSRNPEQEEPAHHPTGLHVRQGRHRNM